MNPAAVEAWAWILLYSGLLTGVLGLFTQSADPALGLVLIVAGLAGVLGGLGLIFWRSRMLDDRLDDHLDDSLVDDR